MGTTEKPETPFSCSVGNCNLHFNGPRELQVHKEELHGELSRHLQAGCGFLGASSTDHNETKLVKEQKEDVVSKSNSEVRVPSPAATPDQALDVDKVAGQLFHRSSSTVNIAPNKQSTEFDPAKSPDPAFEERPLVFNYAPLPEGAQQPRTIPQNGRELQLQGYSYS